MRPKHARFERLKRQGGDGRSPAPAVAKPKSQIELAQERALERAKKNPAAKLAKTDDADINRDLTDLPLDLPLHELSDYLRQFPTRPSTHLDKLKKVESAIKSQAFSRGRLSRGPRRFPRINHRAEK